MHLSQLCSNLPAKLGHQHMGFLLWSQLQDGLSRKQLPDVKNGENDFIYWWSFPLFLLSNRIQVSNFSTWFNLGLLYLWNEWRGNLAESKCRSSRASEYPTAPATPCEGKRNHPHMHPEVHTWPPNGTLVVHCFIWHFVYKLSYFLSAKLQFLLVSVLLTELFEGLWSWAESCEPCTTNGPVSDCSWWERSAILCFFVQT